MFSLPECLPEGGSVYTLRCLTSFREANLNVFYQMQYCSPVIYLQSCCKLTCQVPFPNVPGGVWVARGGFSKNHLCMLVKMASSQFLSSRTDGLLPPAPLVSGSEQRGQDWAQSFPTLHHPHSNHHHHHRHSNPRSWTKKRQTVLSGEENKNVGTTQKWVQIPVLLLQAG